MIIIVGAEGRPDIVPLANAEKRVKGRKPVLTV
jgi:hypothetical protein